MNRHEVDRAADSKYRDCVERTIATLKSLPEDVWPHFVDDIQKGEPYVFEEAHRLVEQTCLDAIRACSDRELKLLWFGSDALWERQGDNPSSRAAWEKGVLKELHQRVKYAAGDAAPDGEEREKGDANNEFLFGGSFAMVEGVWRAGAGCSAVGGLRVQAGEGG